MISANGGLPAHRYTPQVTPRWPHGSEPASRHAKTVAYHSRLNGRAEVAGRQMFQKFRQLHIDEPGWNW